MYSPIVTLILLASLSALGAQTDTQASGNAPDVFRRSSPSVVTVLTSQGQGSGVLVDSKGVLVTNLHVLRGETTATVKLANGDAYDNVEVVDVDERKDLILIRIKGFNLAAAEFGDSDKLVVGQAVFAIGTPKGMDLTISQGIISSVRDSGDGYRLIQTTAAISAGSSGGGLFDASSRLIGVTTFKLVGGESLNFALPINYVRGMIGSQTAMSLAEFASKYPRTTEQPSTASIQNTDNAPALARGYTSGTNFAMFEARPDGSIYASFSTASGVVYGRASLRWDKAKGAFVGTGTVKTVCGEFDTRIWDAPVEEEVYVISSGFIRERWTQPIRVNCSRGQVTQSVWQEAIWYVPR